MKKLILALLIIPLALANSYAQEDTVWSYNNWPDSAEDVLFLNDQTIVLLDHGSELHFFNVETGEKLEKNHAFFSTLGYGSRAMALHPDGKTIIIGGYEKSLLFWDNQSEETIKEKDLEFGCEDIALSPDGNFILIAFERNYGPYNIGIYDIEKDSLIFKYKSVGWPGWPVKVAYSPDSAYFAIASWFPKQGNYASIVAIFDANSFELLKEFHEHYREINSLKFSPNSQYLASCALEGQAVIYNVNDLEVETSIYPENYVIVPSLDFSKDSRYLVIGGITNDSPMDYLTSIYDIETSERTYEYGFASSVDILVSSDNNHILLVSPKFLYYLNAKWMPVPVEQGQANTPPLLYPNPASHSARIEYELEKRGGVSIAIYGQGGALVEKLFEGVEPAGARIHEWDVSGIPPGAYYCRISGKAIDKTFKIIVER